MKENYHTVLTIAGSDSSGGAGIQADIKSISACGSYAASVITATTAQNTQAVLDVHEIPISHIEKQMDAVFTDIQIDAVKIGMLHSCEVITCVKEKLKSAAVEQIVLDPVMVATSGDVLITEQAVGCLKAFLPCATLITPNMAEASLLLGHPISPDQIKSSARILGEVFGTSVLLKGGQINGSSHQIADVFYHEDTKKAHVVTHQRINTKNTHGSGCSLSASIAAFLSLGDNLEVAVRKGCNYVHDAIKYGKDKQLGNGYGPINHFKLP